MKKIVKNINLSYDISTFFCNNSCKNFNHIFLDIETTGLSRSNDIIMVVGIMSFSGEQLKIVQLFSEKESDELDILLNLTELIEENSHIITYNGNSFDIGFINTKLNKYKLPLLAQNHIYSDIYTWAKKIEFQGLESKRLKALEHYLNIHRIDSIEAPELIRSYKLYDETKDTKILENILLHNYEDVVNLYELWNISSLLPIELQNSMVVRVSSNYRYLYKFFIRENYIRIEGLSVLKNAPYIHHTGSYMKLDKKRFTIKLNTVKMSLNGTINVLLFDIPTISSDFNIKIPLKYGIIEQDGVYNYPNIEKIIDLLFV